jgi:hypothetical protein
MSRPNHRALRAALSTALALTLLLIAGAAVAQKLPQQLF